MKQKKGIDQEDFYGIGQLVEIAADDKNAIKILFPTADNFTEKCKHQAEDENVILISGFKVAEMLAKYL